MIKYSMLLPLVLLTGCGAQRSTIYHSSYTISVERGADSATVSGVVTRDTDLWIDNNIQSSTGGMTAHPSCRVEYGKQFSVVVENKERGEFIMMYGVVERELGNDLIAIKIEEKAP